MGLSDHEDDLWIWLEVEQPGEWEREYRFHPVRRWRFDFARVDDKLAVEIDGLTYGSRKGAHQTPQGVERDREKDAEAMLLGWKVLRITPKMLKSGVAYTYIRQLTKEGM